MIKTKFNVNKNTDLISMGLGLMFPLQTAVFIQLLLLANDFRRKCPSIVENHINLVFIVTIFNGNYTDKYYFLFRSVVES